MGGGHVGCVGPWVCGVAAPCASGGMRHVWIGRDALLSLERRGDRCSWSSVVRAMLTCKTWSFRAAVAMFCMYVSMLQCVACYSAHPRFRQPAPLNSCFQLGYSLLKFTKDLLNTCLQLAYSLLTACLLTACLQLACTACFQPAYRRATSATEAASILSKVSRRSSHRPALLLCTT
jgi:hypothetical protein